MNNLFKPIAIPGDKAQPVQGTSSPIFQVLSKKYEEQNAVPDTPEQVLQKNPLDLKARLQKIGGEAKQGFAEADKRQADGTQRGGSTGLQKLGTAVKAVAETVTIPIGMAVDSAGKAITAGREKQKQLDDQRIADGTLNEADALSRKPHIEDQIAELVGKGLNSEQGQKMRDYYDSLSPEAKGNVKGVTDLLSGAFDLATLGIGKKVVQAGGKKVLEKVAKDSAEKAVVKVAKASEKQLISTIEAINPELKGKQLIDAYKDVAKGDRAISPGGVVKKQDISPDQRTLELAQRTSGLGLGKDAGKNLKIVGKELQDTETKLTKALEGDPEINFNADKPTLFTKLQGIKEKTPREFGAIKDSKTAYDDVVDFADKIVKESDDSITGLRNARSAFDAQARKEYPNAFKEGTIDTKTPAGRAIKEVRDAMNDHLYDTAPNGSEIKDLVGREADMFRIIDSVAPKAAKDQGKSYLKKLMEEHPQLKDWILPIIGGGIVGSAAKSLVD